MTFSSTECIPLMHTHKNRQQRSHFQPAAVEQTMNKTLRSQLVMLWPAAQAWIHTTPSSTLPNLRWLVMQPSYPACNPICDDTSASPFHTNKLTNTRQQCVDGIFALGLYHRKAWLIWAHEMNTDFVIIWLVSFAKYCNDSPFLQRVFCCNNKE